MTSLSRDNHVIKISKSNSERTIPVILIVKYATLSKRFPEITQYISEIIYTKSVFLWLYGHILQHFVDFTSLFTVQTALEWCNSAATTLGLTRLW